MSLSDLVNVQISVAASAPSLAGFGTPLVATYHTHYSDRVRTYSSLAGMVSDGFAVTDPGYLAAAELVEQTPHPPSFKVGRRALPFTQQLTLTCLDAAAGDVYDFKLAAAGTSPTEYKMTVPGSSSTSAMATLLAALINGLSPVVATGTAPPTVTVSGAPTVAGNYIVAITTGGSVGTAVFKWSDNGGASYTSGVTTASTVLLTGTGVTVAFSAGTYVTDNVYTWTATIPIANLTCTPSGSAIDLNMAQGFLLDVQTDALHLSLADITADPGVATDLAAIAAADNTWYGLVLDSQSANEVLAAAAWVEANQKIFPANNSDTNNGSTPSLDTSSLAHQIKARGYTRTGVLFSQSELLSYSGAAWMSTRLTATPGSDTWAYKGPLSGVLVDNLTENVQSNCLAKNANVYISVAGADFVIMGSSGSGEFFDLVRGIDAFQNDMQIAILAALLANPKIPYTDAGMTVIESLIRGSIDRFIKNGLLAQVPQPVIFIPPVATQNPSDVSKRNVPGITFTATLAGAVHTLVINGSVVLP